MKKYLALTITRKDGSTFRNPLKLSETHLISKAAQENKKIEIILVEVTKEDYKTIFG